MTLVKEKKNHLPPGCREDMLVLLVPAPLDDFACMRFVLLLCSVCEETHIVVHIKIEQRTRFAPGFVNDEVVECVMLWERNVVTDTRNKCAWTYMWYD
jgi:hypothetical protein